MTSTLINFRVDEKLKNESQKILKKLGISTSDLMKYALQYVVENKKLPISLKIVDIEAKQTKKSETRFQVIQDKITSGKNTFMYSRIGAGASLLLSESVIQMVRNGNGVIISNHLLNNSFFLDDLAETANSLNKEIKVLHLKGNPTAISEFEYGLNPILGESVETLIHFIFGGVISEAQNKFYRDFIDTLKSISSFNNLLELEAAIQANDLKSYGFSEDELKYITLLTYKIHLINNSDFSSIFNNLNVERNISFREVLNKNEILMIGSDYFLSGESYELAKELISNLLDFALHNSGNSTNTNYVICSDMSVFVSKSILRNIVNCRRFKLHYVYQSMGFKKSSEKNEIEYIINSNCHNKVIIGHPDIMIDYDHLKTFFGYTVAARLANDVKDGIALIDENMDHHYYTK